MTTEEHPRAEIFSIGDELVQGWNTDTNSGEIARELLTIGVRVARFTTIRDDRDAIARAFAEASARVDCIIVTGGLGPTDDDLTREAASDALGVDLEFVAELWDAIVTRLRGRGRPIPESNKRQAFRPVGAASIRNNNGTAPGLAFVLGRTRCYALPGVPREMRPMLADFVITDIVQHFPGARPHHREIIKCFGAPEAAIGEVLRPWMVARNADPLVGITVSNAIHTISLLSTAAERCRQTANDIAAAITQQIGPIVYARENVTLEHVLVREFTNRGWTVSFAESCTGGIAASLVTAVPGSSAVLRESYITYHNEAKCERLGVGEEIIQKHGAVSAECAAAMARGAREAARADVAVAVTGIAGPEGGTATKPVGLVYFGVATKKDVRTVDRNYSGLERNFVRDIAAREALNLARLVAGSGAAG